MLVGLAGALLIGILTIAGQAMTSGIYVVGVLILLGVLVVAISLSIIGVAVGWSSYCDPACKNIFPIVGLVFNGSALALIVPAAGWLVWMMYSRA